MKRIQFLTGMLIFTGLTIGVMVNINLTAKNDQSGLTLKNVEALATGEEGEGGCLLTGEVPCPRGGTYALVYGR